jgi:phosphoribosylglycinamide formyltransferase-1
MSKPRLLVFASGTATGGGSGFEKLVEAEQRGDLAAEIVLVVSNHHFGGVAERAIRLGKKPLTCQRDLWNSAFYQAVVKLARADFVAFSGWLLKAEGLDPRITFNIHPGPLPDFGGDGMYGHHVHEAVMTAYRRGELTESAVSMHFVTAEYDKGPVFFRYPVPIQPDDNPETLAARVNAAEHERQWQATNAVVTGEVHWDGVNPGSLVVPDRRYFVKARQR